MPDTELMDRTLALITAAPELHVQYRLDEYIGDSADQLAHRHRKLAECSPVLAVAVEPAECGSAHCFGGWALILAGWRYNRYTRRFSDRDGQGEWEEPLVVAAQVLDIPLAEAYDQPRSRGLFWNWNSLAQIRAWVAYYKGEITEQELDTRLKEEADA